MARPPTAAIERAIALLLLLVAVIHVLPLIGFLGADQLARLYAVNASDPNLEILLRHRAVLFGVLGGICVFAVFRPGYRPLAFCAAGISIVSFLYLCWSVGSINDALGGVLIADLVAAVALAAAIGLEVMRRRKSD